MIVFGDAARLEDPRAKLNAIEEGLVAYRAMPNGLDAHAALVAVLIEAGALLQGVADAETGTLQHDVITPAQTATLLLVATLARATWASWQSGFRERWPVLIDDVLERIVLPRSDLLRSDLPQSALPQSILPQLVRTRLAEGFAFYGVYPEAYAAAAAAAALPPSTTIIGLRSIGTTLAAMVAAGAGARDLTTLRPRGDSFDRQVALSPDLTARLLQRPNRTFAIVDEGPGLSGSSFGAVTRFLTEGGVEPTRIHLFPSHGGTPGAQASAARQREWAQAPRHVRTFDDLVLHGSEQEHRLETWIADLVGPLHAPLEDVSGGGWRAYRYRDAADWPPAHPFGERRKFLARAASGTWLVKFAGLGREGLRKAARAQALAQAGFAPAVAGMRYGFIVERWVEDTGVLKPEHGHAGRVAPAALAAWLGRYLPFRATRFGHGEAWDGATPLQLWTMARHNTVLALGAEAGCRLNRWEAAIPEIARQVRPVEVDGRLHRWEWLVLADGNFLKCDAVDHHAAHDLVGCQDIAWDVAGASVELALPDAACETLVETVAAKTARPIAPALLAFHRHCYLAFQMGAATMAAQAAGDGHERCRWEAEVARYGRLLSRALYEEDA